MRSKLIGQSPEYNMLYEILRKIERITQMAPHIGWDIGPVSPTVQASSLTVTDITDTTITFSWTKGNGASTLMLIKQGSAVDALPEDNTTYTPNGTFGSGSELGTGNYTVYSSTGNSVSITALTQDLTYHIRGFAYNSQGSLVDYMVDTSSGNPINPSTFTTEYQNVIDFANAA